MSGLAVGAQWRCRAWTPPCAQPALTEKLLVRGPQWTGIARQGDVVLAQ